MKTAGVCCLSSKHTGAQPSMNREFKVIVERDAQGLYVARVPELPGCHSQAKSPDILMKRIREAITLCLEAEKQANESTDSRCSEGDD